MSGIPATFWGQPIRYLRWASHEKPAIFWSVVLGSFGPVALFGLPPLRKYLGDEDPSLIPHTYPVPTGPRKIPEGFDDPKPKSKSKK